MDPDQRRFIVASDPGKHITGPDRTGTVRQQMNFAASSLQWICQLEFGYAPEFGEVLKLVESSVRTRGIIE